MSESIPGSCLCGAVRFKVAIAERKMGVCHCGMCRRWTGGVFMAVEADRIDMAEGVSIGVFASSDYGERVFCRECGSSLFWRMRDGSSAAVSLQALDDLTYFEFESEIFIDEKPPIYDFANHTKKMTGAEFVAALTGGEG